MVQFLPDVWLWQWLIASGILLFSLLFSSLAPWRFVPVLKQGLIALLLFSIGASWGSLWAKMTLAPLPEALIKQDAWVTGKVLDIPKKRSHALRFRFQIETITLEGKAHENQAYDFHEKVFLNWYDKPFPQLQSGQRWRLKVRLKPAHGSFNPGGFDYEKWLYSEGIRATGYVRAANKSAQRLAPTSDSINQLRAGIQQFIKSQNLQHGGIFAALTVGIRDGIDDKAWKVFRDTGTAHLVAISGLHIGMVAGLMYFLANWFWRFTFLKTTLYPAQKVGRMAALIAALIYAALAGFSLPTLRAFLMLLAYFSLQWLRRNPSTLFTLGFVLLVVLIFDPLSPLSASLWLSFGAVTAIAWALKAKAAPPQEDPIEALTNPASRWQKLLSTLRLVNAKWWKVQWAVFIALLPLGLLFFQQFSWVSMLANAAAIPLVAMLVVPLLLLATFLHLLRFDTLPIALMKMADSIFDLLWIMLEKLAGLPFAIWQSAVPSNLAFFLALMGSFLLLASKLKKARLLGALAFIPLFLPNQSTINPPAFEAHIIDVGQGLSVLIKTQTHALLFDAGVKYDEGFDAGEMIIKPFLLHQGVRKIDAMVLSHDNRDHTGGAEAILASSSVERLYATAGFYKNAAACQAGQSWQWDGVKFTFLHPIKNSYSANAADENNASCVLKVSSTLGTLLLTGDIEREAEAALLNRAKQQLSADVLLMPHHGSRSSSGLGFVRAVNAKLAIASAGFLNRFKHPHPTVIARYEQNKTQTLNTANSGWIKLVFAHKGIAATPWRAVKSPYWADKKSIGTPLFFERNKNLKN